MTRPFHPVQFQVGDTVARYSRPGQVGTIRGLSKGGYAFPNLHYGIGWPDGSTSSKNWHRDLWPVTATHRCANCLPDGRGGTA